jgi:hypothetical protein
MRLRGAWAGTAVVLVGALARAAAGAPSLRLEAQAHAAPASAVDVVATNVGDTPAVDVVPTAIFQHGEFRGRPVSLAPGERHEWQIALPPPERGTHPVIVRVHYGDLVGNSASTPVVTLLPSPDATPTAVRATLTTHPVSGAGSVRLRLENPGPGPAAGRVVVVVPAVLRPDPEAQPAQVPAGGVRDLPIMLDATAASPGAAYPAYALFEFDAGGEHHTVLADTIVPIHAASPAGRWTSLAVAGGALLFTLALVALALRRTRRRA